MKTLVTELQQAIFDELDKYSDLDTARERAQEIADKVATLPNIPSCSKAYVLRMIKRKGETGAKVEISVEPPAEESEEPEEDEEEHEPQSDSEEPDDFFFEDDEEEEEEESDQAERVASLDLSQIITKENVGILISAPFRFATQWTKYEGWLLTAEEKKRLTPLARQLLIKYIPDVMTTYFLEVMFVVLVLEVVGTKAINFREHEDDRLKTIEAQKKAKESARQRQRQEQEETKAKELQQEPAQFSKDDPANQPDWMGDGRMIG